MTADVLALRRSPLGDPPLDVRGPRLHLRELAFRTLLELRGPTGRPAVGPDEHVWPLGPGWWLVDGKPDAAPALESPRAAAWRAALGPGAGVVDVSCHRTTFALSGPDALLVLSHGCSIDLERVPVGQGVQGVLAHAQVVLGRVGQDDWRIHPRASFARHLAAWLVDAAAESWEPWGDQED